MIVFDDLDDFGDVFSGYPAFVNVAANPLLVENGHRGGIFGHPPEVHDRPVIIKQHDGARFFLLAFQQWRMTIEE